MHKKYLILFLCGILLSGSLCAMDHEVEVKKNLCCRKGWSITIQNERFKEFVDNHDPKFNYTHVIGYGGGQYNFLGRKKHSFIYLGKLVCLDGPYPYRLEGGDFFFFTMNMQKKICWMPCGKPHPYGFFVLGIKNEEKFLKLKDEIKRFIRRQIWRF